MIQKRSSSSVACTPKWDAERVDDARVDKYATVIIAQNGYPVPSQVGESVLVKVYAERIRCYADERCVADHERLTGNHRKRLELAKTLQKNPGTLAGGLALQVNLLRKCILLDSLNSS